MDFFYHYLQVILLGIVEGVTEFLPISSTGHLLIAEDLLQVHEPDVFNVVIQAGAILAVVFVYWRKLADLFGNLDRPESRQYLLKIAAAFCVTGALGFVLTHSFHLKLPETLLPVAWATLIGGLVIFAIEGLARNLYPHEDISWPEALLMGLAQIVAGVFPGTSRSGATIMTGLAMGMRRPVATEFSFLVGIPTMFAASALEIVKYRKDLTGGGHQLLLDIVVGFIVSAVVAFFVIKWLLRFVQSHTFNGFAIYRVILGGGLLIAIYTHPALAQIGASKEPVGIQPGTVEKSRPNVPIPPVINTDSAPIPPVAPAPSAPAPMEVAPTPTTDAAPVASGTSNATPTLQPSADPTPAPANVPASQN